MGKFDGVLLASDFDNTLLNTETARRTGAEVPEVSRRNREALEYFMAGGGRFAIATGRALAAFIKFADQVPMNAPGIVCNGAALYDFQKGEYLETILLDESTRRRGQETLDRFPTLAVEAYHIDNVIHAVRPNLYTRQHEHVTHVSVVEKPSLLDALDEFNLRMAQTGALVISYRARYVKALAQEAARYHREFSGDSESLELTYRTVSTVTDPFAPPETLCAQLQEHQRSHARAELESAQCLSGPHKDDFEAVINGLPVAQFASQGQTRTAVISLKLAERALLRQGTGETPVLLLDDVLSELDAGRQDFVLNQLREGQVFITCCETDRLTSLGQVLSIRSGTIGGAQ